MFSKGTLTLLTIALVGFVSFTTVKSSVLGVDFGGEFIKSSFILPGKAFQILEDTTSKRKTPSSVAFTNSERVFEWGTIAKKAKAYQTTFTYLQRYLGKTVDDKELLETAQKYWEDYILKENDVS